MERGAAVKASLLQLLPLMFTSWSLSMLLYRYLASDHYIPLQAPTTSIMRHMPVATPSQVTNMVTPSTFITHTKISSTHIHGIESQIATSNMDTYVHATNIQASVTNIHSTNIHIDYTTMNTSYGSMHTDSIYTSGTTTFSTVTLTNDNIISTSIYAAITYTLSNDNDITNSQSHSAASDSHTENPTPQFPVSTMLTSSASVGYEVECEEEYQKEGARQIVLLWTPFWHSWTAWREILQDHGRLREGRCPKWRCDFLLGTEASTAQVAEAAAVVFFGLDALSRPLPPRYSHTLWIWLELEAPPLSQLATDRWSQLEAMGVFFNLTLSYHHFNLVMAPFGQLVPLSTLQHCPLPSVSRLVNSSSTHDSYSRHMQEFDLWVRLDGERTDSWLQTERRRLYGGLLQQPKDESTAVDSLLQDRYDRKTDSEQLELDDGGSMMTAEEVRWATRPRLAAWMASHCHTESRREDLVAALKRSLAITTVGKCGELQCGKNHKDAYCYRWLAASHLFYLSFENALCEDYHTEKLWRALEHAMVPVVYGAPTYRHILPFDSYIDVMTFPNAAALADYLLHLATHPSAYLRFLQWRRYWQVRWPVPWCGLCAILHDQVHYAHATLDLWWNSTSTCYAPLIL